MSVIYHWKGTDKLNGASFIKIGCVYAELHTSGTKMLIQAGQRVLFYKYKFDSYLQYQ